MVSEKTCPHCHRPIRIKLKDGYPFYRCKECRIEGYLFTEDIQNSLLTNEPTIDEKKPKQQKIKFKKIKDLPDNALQIKNLPNINPRAPDKDFAKFKKPFQEPTNAPQTSKSIDSQKEQQEKKKEESYENFKFSIFKKDKTRESNYNDIKPPLYGVEDKKNPLTPVKPSSSVQEYKRFISPKITLLPEDFKEPARRDVHLEQEQDNSLVQGQAINISDHSQESSDVFSNVFAVSRVNRVITRKFVLIPTNTANISTIYNQFDKFFIDLKNLQNRLLHKMHDNLSNGILSIADFGDTSNTFIKNIYYKLKFDLERGEYKERIVRCATNSPYQAYRNWLIRNYNVSVISNLLSLTFSIYSEKNLDVYSNFLGTAPLPYDYLDYLFNNLLTNVFGEIQANNLSNFYISNMIRQLKNILFFNYKEEIDGYLRLCLENLRKERMDNSSYKINNFMSSCLSDFYRKEKKEWVKIPAEGLSSYLLDIYFLTLKRMGTKRKKTILLRSNDITNSELKNMLKLSKKDRNAIYNRTKEDILNSLEKVDLRHIISIAFDNIFKYIDSNPKISLLKLVFNPSFLSVLLKKPSLENFIEYVGIKFENKLRERFRDFFISPELTNLISYSLKTLSDRIRKNDINLIKLPEIKSGSLSINDLSIIFSRNEDQKHELYSQLITSKKFQMSLIPYKEFFKFDIGNKGDNRILNIFEKYKNRIVRICLPIVTYENRKLILHLPFEIKRKDELIQSNVKSEGIVLGLDLGLKHFGVVSVEDKRANVSKEIARYFIGQKQLFDMKFVDGKFIQRSRFKNMKCKQHITNIKRRLISIRKEIQNVQSRQDNRKNELKKTGIVDYNLDIEYKNLQSKLSRLWKRVYHINLEVIRVLSHDVIEIAKYYHVDTIKVEDLRFSTHSKKREVGRFISFWQVHWLFSKVQEAIELQAYLNNIEFKRVNAKYTSQRCSICGELGVRDGKEFRCDGLVNKTKKHKSIQLDADLNAARNIALSST